MTYNITKLIVVGVLALALIVGLLFGLDAAVAVPLLTLLVGYIVGNAQLSSREGDVAPIVNTRPLAPPEFP